MKRISLIILIVFSLLITGCGTKSGSPADTGQPATQTVVPTEQPTAEKMADGQATKIIVPSEIANLSGTLTALAETVHTPQTGHPQPSRNAAGSQPVRRESAVKPQAQKPGIIDRIMNED